MAKFSLSPQFLKDTWKVFRRKPLREIIFGKTVQFSKREKDLIEEVENDFSSFRSKGAKRGELIKISLPHQGKGWVYLLPNVLGKSDQESLLIFSDDTTIVPGPDLYVYLSTEEDARRGLGDIINLGLLKGTKGGQTYLIREPIKELKRYKSAVIYCKQFEELFTFAALT